MPSAKQQILALIPQLSPMDVMEVRGALNALGEVQGAALEPDLFTDWLLSGMITYLAGKGLLTSKGAIYELQRRAAYKSYKRKLPEVMRYLDKLEKQAKTKTHHRPQLALLAARALAELLESRNIFSVNAMMTQIDKLPEAINRSYPSYVQAGLFGVVLNGGLGG